MRTCQSARPHRYSVQELLSMSTISERHPDIHSRAEVAGGGSDDRESNWIIDPGSGVLCPPPPGKVTPIIEMPKASAAVWYLEHRGFDIQRLWEQFRCSWCYEEHPEKQNNVFYRRMPGGWRDTGQSRLIFYGLHNGAPLTWQARYPEYTTEDKLNKYALNPYTLQWDHVATRAAGHQSWFPVSPFDQVNETGSLKWSPSKYRTAPHGYRDMIGWDAAVANPDHHGFRWCVLCEGPLDAARVGPGGLAIMGKSLNAEKAAKVAAEFHIVFTAFDNDTAGREATEKISRTLLGAKLRNPMTQLVQQLAIPEGLLHC